MRARSVGAVLAVAMAVVACATAVPPKVPVTSLASLAGTYTGNMTEKGQLERTTRLVLQADGKFELTASDPAGFRTLGAMALGPDGVLRYKFDELRGRGEFDAGTATVHEGDGKRAIVMSHDSAAAVITVWKGLP